MIFIYLPCVAILILLINSLLEGNSISRYVISSAAAACISFPLVRASKYEKPDLCPRGAYHHIQRYLENDKSGNIYFKIEAADSSCNHVANLEVISWSVYERWKRVGCNDDPYCVFPKAMCVSGHFGGAYRVFVTFGANRQAVMERDCLLSLYDEPIGV
uniref:ARAD1A00242p n=1 Tax=Blastobotrys adeninivorans TaxID=409370 RepID=A0A060SWA6_BLAAD